jgi:DNA-binding MarR family transcriptional regulator
MECRDDTTIATVHKLMRAFMLFRKIDWHQHSAAGYTPSELRVLFCIRGWMGPDNKLRELREKFREQMESGVMFNHREIEEEMRREYKRRMELRPPAVKVSEISKRLHVTSPTVTQLLKVLESDGLVERHSDPRDRRSVDFKLTERGEEVTQQAAEAYWTSINGLIEYLGEEESNHLAELLFKAIRYYSEQAADADYALWTGDREAHD